MAELTHRLAEILRMYLSEEELKTACWQHKKSGDWLIRHWTLNTIKTRAGIILDDPEHILERAEPETVVLRQRGRVAHKGVTHEAWAYGVADKENCHIPHRYPIARKRGEDVVILELLGKMHDYAVRGELYGEDEADWDGPKAESGKTARVREQDARKAELEHEAGEAFGGDADDWMAKIEGASTLDELKDVYAELTKAGVSKALHRKLEKVIERRGAVLMEKNKKQAEGAP